MNKYKLMYVNGSEAVTKEVWADSLEQAVEVLRYNPEPLISSRLISYEIIENGQ